MSSSPSPCSSLSGSPPPASTPPSSDLVTPPPTSKHEDSPTIENEENEEGEEEAPKPKRKVPTGPRKKAEYVPHSETAAMQLEPTRSGRVRKSVAKFGSIMDSDMIEDSEADEEGGMEWDSEEDESFGNSKKEESVSAGDSEEDEEEADEEEEEEGKGSKGKGKNAAPTKPKAPKKTTEPKGKAKAKSVPKEKEKVVGKKIEIVKKGGGSKASGSVVSKASKVIHDPFHRAMAFLAREPLADQKVIGRRDKEDGHQDYQEGRHLQEGVPDR